MRVNIVKGILTGAFKVLLDVGGRGKVESVKEAGHACHKHSFNVSLFVFCLLLNFFPDGHLVCVNRLDSGISLLSFCVFNLNRDQKTTYCEENTQNIEPDSIDGVVLAFNDDTKKPGAPSH